jgi:hypothetical protein
MLKKIHSQDLASNIESWIKERLSVKSEVFNGLPPCPYAQSAWLDGKVKTHHLDGKFPLTTHIPAEIENYTYHWPKGFEVVVLGFDPLGILPSNLSDIIDDAKPMLNKRGYTALEDHPFEREEVGNVWLNNGEWALVLIQPTDKLIEARQWLEGKNYYKNWDPIYKESVQSR